MEAAVTAVPASYGGRPKEAAPVSSPDKPLPEVPFSDAVAPPGAASAASMRSDIGVMEQYLQEMTVDAKDPRGGGPRGLMPQMTPSTAARQRPEPNMVTSVSRLRSAVAPNGLVSPTSHPAGPRPLPTPTPSSSTAAAAATGQQSAALQDMYQDLERDLESLSAVASRAPQSVLVTRTSSAAPPAPPKSGSPEGVYAVSPGPAGARKSSLTWTEPRSAMARAASGAAARAGAGALPAPPPPSVPLRSANPAVVDGDRPFDGEWALEKMKEVEMVLNTLQRDLDSICGKACQLAKLGHPNSAKAS
ncbi:hypothetical protein HK405_015495, partial [Cladochytrium tenue]